LDARAGFDLSNGRSVGELSAASRKGFGCAILPELKSSRVTTADVKLESELRGNLWRKLGVKHYLGEHILWRSLGLIDRVAWWLFEAFELGDSQPQTKAILVQPRVKASAKQGRRT
jgi:hypothetical protein